MTSAHRTKPANAAKTFDVALSIGPIGLAAGLAMIILTLVALFPTHIAPFNPNLRVAPPFTPPSLAHWFGTDEIGRDLFSRVLLALRFTWFPTLGLIAFSSLVGSAIGVIAGAAGGVVDVVVQRVIDLFLSVPSILVALAIAATLGPGLLNTVLAIAVTWWPWYAIIARDEARRLKARPHFDAARTAGIKRPRLLLRYLLPGIVPSIVAAGALDVANVITTLALMSFLGLGQPDPAPELGSMISRSMDSLTVFWWLPIIPGLVIFVLCLMANLFGEAVRSTLRGR